MDDEYLEAVLDLVADVPPGRVMTYGGIAEVLRDRTGRGGARQVGQVMALAGGGVPWWRVVNAAAAAGTAAGHGPRPAPRGGLPADRRRAVRRRRRACGRPTRGVVAGDLSGQRVSGSAQGPA